MQQREGWCCRSTAQPCAHVGGSEQAQKGTGKRPPSWKGRAACAPPPTTPEKRTSTHTFCSGVVILHLKKISLPSWVTTLRLSAPVSGFFSSPSVSAMVRCFFAAAAVAAARRARGTKGMVERVRWREAQKGERASCALAVGHARRHCGSRPRPRPRFSTAKRRTFGGQAPLSLPPPRSRSRRPQDKGHHMTLAQEGPPRPLSPPSWVSPLPFASLLLRLTPA